MKELRGASIPGAMETTFKCYTGAIIMLITFGRIVHQVTRYRPHVLITVTHNPPDNRTGPSVSRYCLCLCKNEVQVDWVEDLDL
ncbi:rCG52566, partial [Rattus norvegicus]